MSKNKCDFCGVKNGVLYESSDNTFILEEGGILWWHDWNGSVKYQLNYCPICGEKLNK